MTAERVKSGLERAKAQGNVRQAPIDSEKQEATRGRGHRLRERLKRSPPREMPLAVAPPRNTSFGGRSAPSKVRARETRARTLTAC